MSGLGRPLIAAPETPKRLLSGDLARAPIYESKINLFQLIPWYSPAARTDGRRSRSGSRPRRTEAAAVFTELETRYFAALLERRSRQAA
ncbi:MAG: hypothetical protein WDN69_33385 [Aliidongia sp.]